jgi:tripartite-type tricarboxylate transporter receptor subunit TctC
VREGRLRALAVTAAERSGALPGVPTAAEAGYPDLVVTSWQGLLAPAATPEAAVARLNAEVNAALANPELRAWILAQGSEPVGGPPERLASLLRRDLPRWAEAVRRSGAKLD